MCLTLNTRTSRSFPKTFSVLAGRGGKIDFFQAAIQGLGEGFHFRLVIHQDGDRWNLANDGLDFVNALEQPRGPIRVG